MVSDRRLELSLQPSVLRWARERSSLDLEELAHKAGVKVERVRDWEETGRISIAQVERLAQKTHTPEGFLYLPFPPEDRLQIPDLRTVGDTPPPRPSPDLLDTVHAMERRQAWMRDELIEQGADRLPFVGSATPDAPTEDVARAMRDVLDLQGGWAADVPTWTDALRMLHGRIDEAGVLTVSNGVVGNNTHRRLDPDEFRGFSLVDEYASLVFVNAADFKSAQMFTLIHELAHIWMNASGVDNPNLGDPDAPRPDIEQRSNAIAAEFLIPAADLRVVWARVSNSADRFEQVARIYKTSRIVAARRALDLNLIGRTEFFDFYAEYEAEERRTQRPQGEGGDFWKTQGARLGRRFSQAVVEAVQEGRLLYRDAYSLTGLQGPTFDKYVDRVRAES